MSSTTVLRHKTYALHIQPPPKITNTNTPSRRHFRSSTTKPTITTNPKTTATMMSHASPYPDTATAHNRDLALQKYMLLYSQHQSLREHLDQLRPLVTMTSCNTAVTSPAHSPERTSPHHYHHQHGPVAAGPAPSFAARAHRRSSMPAQDPSDYGVSSFRRSRTGGGRLESLVDERTLYEMMSEERKLFDVNECMKRTLTELLNCDDARTDREFRMWVQCRLMETERELRTERRRRSSAASVEVAGY